MAQSKLELAVGTGQWDAGLRKAQQALNSFTQAQGGLQQALDKDNGKMQSFVQMMGKMDSTASTSKGQMNDYKRVLEQLTADYNKMSEAQRKSIGTDYLQTIDALKQKFQAAKQQVDEFNRSLGNTSEIKLPEGGSGLFGGGKLDGMLQVFGGNMMTKAAGFAASFASEIGSCVQQGIELARQGEGIRIAFERLGRGDILQGLREATHGTVTDLELMKAAVKFNDFKLPVEELGTMLAFAQQKAKDTGQSVDYMVDSIVTGLGRKSLMILDNLGLSATEIRERMKETGDMTKAVGAIIRDQMKNAGDYVETAADRAAQANVTIQNKMEELGRKFGPVEEASNQLWTSMKIGILDVIGGPLAQLLNSLTEAGRLKNALNDMNGEDGSGNTKVGEQLKKLQVIKKAGGSDYIFKSMLSGMTEEYNRQIIAFDTQIKDLKRKAGEDMEGNMAAVYESRIKDIEVKQKALKTMRDQLAAGAKDIANPKPAPTTPVVPTTKPTKTGKTDIQYADDSIMAQEKLISDLTQKWKTASGELRDGYLKDLEEAQQKLAEMTGKAKGPDLDKLFPDMSKENYNTGYAGSAQAKYDSARADLALGPMNFDAINDYIGSIKGMLKDADLGSELYNSMTEKLKDATTVSTLLQEMMERGLAGADLETTAQALKEKLLSPEGIDQTAIQSFLDTLNEQIEEAGGVGLKLNADTGEVTDDKGKGDGKEQKKFDDGIGKLSGGLSQVASGLKAVGVEIPKEVDQVLGVINGVSQIISGVGTIISIFGITAITANTTAVGLNTAAVTALIAAVEFNSATNFFGLANGGIVPTFAHGGLIGRAAGGMMIPGNSMSGDRLRLPVDGGRGMIGVNSGELILNKSSQNSLAASLLQAESLVDSINDYRVSLGNAQQGMIANALEGGGSQIIDIDWVMRGEDMRAVINNNGRRTGRGEIVQSRRNRS